MTDQPKGLLAIWSTIAPQTETDYLHWLTREHLFERVGVPGFLAGRVFKRLASQPSQYLMLYELAGAEVMASPGYLARLNEPTPWTQRIMPQLQAFRRGGGPVVSSAGDVGAQGGRLALARFVGELPGALAGAQGQQFAAAIAGLDRIVNVRCLQVQPDATAIATREKSMRKGEEGEFAGLLLIEALDDAALAQALGHATPAVEAAGSQFECYETVFACRCSS